MQAKRPSQDAPQAEASNSFSQLIDAETKRKLAGVGSRARKHVSEGHLTAGTSIPSFNGMTVGTLDQEQIRANYLQEMGGSHAHSAGDIGMKRMRDDLDDDGYGDTEDDEDESNRPSLDTQRKLFYRPNSHRSMSSQTEDFEDAQFLRPQR